MRYETAEPEEGGGEVLVKPAGSRGRSSERELRITETHKKQEWVGEI